MANVAMETVVSHKRKAGSETTIQWLFSINQMEEKCTLSKVTLGQVKPFIKINK